jgi:tetratricopeptide (TPR) repeat protein
MRLALALIFVAVSGGNAFADTIPSVWDRARDPEAADAFALHAQVEARLASRGMGRDDLDEAELRAALTMLERGGAERGKSPLLRLDLGNVYEGLKNYPRAAKVYRSLIADFPDHPVTERAWLYLAFACGHIGEHDCEQRAYIEVLRRETEELRRATPLLNLAETQMHLGDLKEAIAGYREALRIAGRTSARDTAPLATWGLAVALDRSGDRAEAERQARFALEIERSMGLQGSLLHDTSHVFFVPEWEIKWYDGLAAIALARQASAGREAITFWRAAERSFEAYVKAAEGKEDRWLPLAKVRLAQIKTERARAEKTAPRATPPPEGHDVTL